MSHNIKQWDTQFSKSPLHRSQMHFPTDYFNKFPFFCIVVGKKGHTIGSLLFQECCVTRLVLRSQIYTTSTHFVTDAT